VGFLFTPFIARVYGPEAYGSFAVFNTLTINLSLLASLGYEQAVILPKTRTQFHSMVLLNLLIIGFFSIFLFFVLLVLPVEFLKRMDIVSLRPWLPVLPLVILFNVFGQVFTSMGVRHKKFLTNSASRVLSVVGTKGYALLHGILIAPKVTGFILSEIGGKLLYLVWLLRQRTIYRSVLKAFSSRSIKSLKQTAQEFIHYPKFNLPAVWTATLSAQIPIFFILYAFGSKEVGYYSMANMLLFIPLNLVGRSVGTVFLQKATELVHSRNLIEIRTICTNIIYLTLMFCILPSILLFIFSKEFFTIFLGEEWVVSGEMARWLLLYVVIELVALPISSLYRVLRQEKQFLFFNLVAIVIILLSLVIGWTFNDIIALIIFLAIGKSIESLLKIIVIMRILNRKIHANTPDY